MIGGEDYTTGKPRIKGIFRAAKIGFRLGRWNFRPLWSAGGAWLPGRPKREVRPFPARTPGGKGIDRA